MRCNALARKAMLSLNQHSCLLGGLISEFFPKLLSILIRLHLEVRTQTCPPIPRRNKNKLRVQSMAAKLVRGLKSLARLHNVRSLKLHITKQWRPGGPHTTCGYLENAATFYDMFRLAVISGLSGPSPKLEGASRAKCREASFPRQSVPLLKFISREDRASMNLLIFK